jgi:uncharacterized linocin/CFP29 family protein
VVSKRGGDFLLDVGQDFAIGYTNHNAEQVTLYLEESFSFRVTEPQAAVVLALAGSTSSTLESHKDVATGSTN